MERRPVQEPAVAMTTRNIRRILARVRGVEAVSSGSHRALRSETGFVLTSVVERLGFVPDERPERRRHPRGCYGLAKKVNGNVE